MKATPATPAWRAEILFDLPVATVPLASGGTRDLRLDLYVPSRVESASGATAGPPMIVYIHGGGWREGTNDRPPGFRSILSRGAAIASVQYRFSNQGTGEDMLEDLKAGLRVAHREASRMGCDTSRWFLWGISAGGHLVSLLAHRLEGPAGGIAPVRGVAPWCGVFDLELYRSLKGVAPANREVVAEITSALLGTDPHSSSTLSPVTYVSPTSPPHFFVHGSGDGLVPADQSRLMHEALVAQGVRSELYLVPGADHAMPPGDSEELHRTLDFFFSL